MLRERVAKNIKKYRKKKGFTQKELAEKAGISKNALWNYENHVRTLPLEVSVQDLTYRSKPSGLTVGVSVKDTEQFKLLIDMMKDILTDERIDKRVREEYYHRYLNEIDEGEGETIEG